MDTYIEEGRRHSQDEIQEEELSNVLHRWLSVSGDMDDFIFFEEPPKKHSER